MQNSEKLRITTPTDREIQMTRTFDAPRSMVFDAMTKPEFVTRWLLGPPGWTMPVCEIDLRMGGTYRYVWRRENGAEMRMGGVFLEVTPPERVVQTEVFEDKWYPGEAVGTMVLTEDDGITTMTLTMRYESREARDAVMKTPMEDGVAASYDRLSDILAQENWG